MVHRQGRALLALLATAAAVSSAPVFAGSLDLPYGLTADWKLTLGYAVAMRMEKQSQALINGPIDVQQVVLNTNPVSCPTLPTPCVGSFGHTGMPTTVLFDDGDRDFKQFALLNNRVSAYGETNIKLDPLGIGDVGLIASGAAHYDQVYQQDNDHDNPDTVNRMRLREIAQDGYVREGAVNEWEPEAVKTNGQRYRLLEAYGYGQWQLTDEMALSLRLGKHLAAWGESLFFPGIASAQGPFDATKANVPGVEVKEILLPVNQISMQLALTSSTTVLAYNQFEFHPTEVFPQGDFFSPADLIGPGATFGYGSINPLHERWCGDPSRVQVANDPTGQGLCVAGAAFTNKPEFIMTPRTPDKLPSAKNQYGVGIKSSITPDFNVGLYYLHYNNHNPNVGLNMGYAYVGDAAGGAPVTTSAFNVRVPVSYTVGYADDIDMFATSFSTVFWIFNIGGEVVHRKNVDTSLEATISGVQAPVFTRGDTTTSQVSLLYVNNPDFLIYDEFVAVGEIGYTHVDKVTPRVNEDGICMAGTDPTPGDNTGDCAPGRPAAQYIEKGDKLFYNRDAAAMQWLFQPKGRNLFPGWDIATPVNFAWLFAGTPSTPGLFGSLYGKGDMRVGFGVTAQYVQNLELSVNYNAFLGSPNRLIGDSVLHANPYTDRDYLSLSVKYNL